MGEGGDRKRGGAKERGRGGDERKRGEGKHQWNPTRLTKPDYDD